MLQVFTPCSEEGEWVEKLVPGLRTTCHQFVVIEELRRVVEHGLVGAVVLT